MLIQQEHLATTTKAKVRNSSLYQYLPQQHTPGRPDMNTVATSRVHVSKGIALYAIRDASVCERKETSVYKEWLTMVVRYAQCITKIESVDAPADEHSA